MGKLQDKVAIVTGGGSGQGRAVSRLFAQEGAKIAVADINLEGAEETVGLIREAGGAAIAVRCDISKGEEVRELVSKTVQTFGRIDILYNNAARNRPSTPVPESVMEMPEEQWYGTIDTNLSGYYLCSKYALPEIVKTQGVIINVASTLGLSGAENQGAYMASKAGVIALTKSMALDYGPRGVRVNAICPGPIETPRLLKHAAVYAGAEQLKRITAGVPLRRLGKPEEIARVALFLASEDSSFVSGAYIPVDGGGAARR